MSDNVDYHCHIESNVGEVNNDNDIPLLSEILELSELELKKLLTHANFILKCRKTERVCGICGDDGQLGYMDKCKGCDNYIHFEYIHDEGMNCMDCDICYNEGTVCPLCGTCSIEHTPEVIEEGKSKLRRIEEYKRMQIIKQEELIKKAKIERERKEKAKQLREEQEHQEKAFEEELQRKLNEGRVLLRRLDTSYDDREERRRCIESDYLRKIEQREEQKVADARKKLEERRKKVIEKRMVECEYSDDDNEYSEYSSDDDQIPMRDI